MHIKFLEREKATLPAFLSVFFKEMVTMTFHINTLSLPIQSKDVKMWRLIMWEAERAVDLHLLQNETK